MGGKDNDVRENKDFPNVQQTRFTNEDDRYLEGDGEKTYLTERSIESPDHTGNPKKTKDLSKKLFDR